MSFCEESLVPLLLKEEEEEEEEEAGACILKAEGFFKENKIDMAIRAIGRGLHKNPNDEDLSRHIAVYMVHKLAAEKNNWYAVLGIADPGAAVDVIRKRYDGIFQLLLPSSAAAAAAEGAMRLVNEAWAVLSDPKRREAYDMLMGYNKNNNRHHCSRQMENRDPGNYNNVVVKLEDRNLPSISERMWANRRPVRSVASSSSLTPGSLRRKTKKVLVIRSNNNGQGVGDNSIDKVIIISTKPVMIN